MSRLAPVTYERVVLDIQNSNASSLTNHKGFTQEIYHVSCGGFKDCPTKIAQCPDMLPLGGSNLNISKQLGNTCTQAQEGSTSSQVRWLI